MSKLKPAPARKILPIYSYPKWVFVLLLFVIATMFAAQYIQNELYKDFLPSVGTFCVLSLIAILVARDLYKTFEPLQETINALTENNQSEWFLRQKFLIFGFNRWSIATTIVLVIGGELTNFFLIWHLWTGIAQISYFFHVGLLFGILGMLGWTFFGVLLFTYNLKNFDLDIEPFETKRDEFNKLNSSLFRIFIAGFIIYLGAVTAGLLSPPLSSMLNITLLKYWSFPLAIIVITFFVLIQYFLHIIMKKAKNSRINKLSLLIRKYYQEWEKSPSDRTSAVINDLLAWKEKIEKESDFPFDFITIITVIVTVFLPAIKSIMEFL